MSKSDRYQKSRRPTPAECPARNYHFEYSLEEIRCKKFLCYSFVLFSYHSLFYEDFLFNFFFFIKIHRFSFFPSNKFLPFLRIFFSFLRTIFFILSLNIFFFCINKNNSRKKLEEFVYSLIST